MKILAVLIFLLLPASAEIKVLKNFTLIDGSGGPAVAGAAMLIDNGRIVRIGSAQRMTPPDGAQVIDLDGKFVMPGIINLHGHIGNTVDLTQNAKFFTRENIEKNLRTYASYGVTTVLSLGTDQDLIFQIRDQQRAGRPTYTRVYTAGQGFTLKGGVGGMPSVTFNLENAAEVPKDIEALAAKRVDIVKVWVDDSFGHRPKIPFEMTKAIIDNAHRHGLRVNAHVFYLADAKQLANAGLDALAHSVRDQPVDQELIDSMKQHGTWQSARSLRARFHPPRSPP
jgi:imidazolonepropionase-like amidohydrolase